MHIIGRILLLYAYLLNSTAHLGKNRIILLAWMFPCCNHGIRLHRISEFFFLKRKDVEASVLHMFPCSLTDIKYQWPVKHLKILIISSLGDRKKCSIWTGQCSCSQFFLPVLSMRYYPLEWYQKPYLLMHLFDANFFFFNEI